MENKPKKHLILSILLCCAISASANAATIETLTLNAGHIKIAGTSDAENVSYKIYKNGDTETDISKICEIGETKVVDGKFSVNIIMPKNMQGTETDGEYRIDIRDTSKASQTFLFTGYSYRAAFLNDLNTKTTGSEIYALFEGNSSDSVHSNIDIMRNLGADTDYYNALDSTEKNKIASAFLAEKGTTVVDEENFSTIYSHAQAVQYINKNTVTQAWLGESDLEFEGVKFQDSGAELKNWILSVIDDGTVYGSYSDAEKKYREANVLYLLNNAKFTEYDALISKYDDAIGITGETYYAAYKNMPALNQSNVNAALKNALAGSKATTKEAFKAAYKKAVEDERTAMSKQNNTAGTGGGGGGGGSSSASGVPIVVPEKTNPTTVVSDFTDIGGVDWAKDAILALAKEGVIAGYEDNTFKPQQNIKREEFVKMVISAARIDLNKPACKFGDVEQNKWYAQYVNAAYGEGVISGMSEAEFGIGKEITREDMAVIIARLVNLDVTETETKFADDADISEYARVSIYKLYAAGKIAGVGNGRFAPKEIVTRAQAAKIIFDTLISGN